MSIQPRCRPISEYFMIWKLPHTIFPRCRHLCEVNWDLPLHLQKTFKSLTETCLAHHISRSETDDWKNLNGRMIYQAEMLSRKCFVVRVSGTCLGSYSLSFHQQPTNKAFKAILWISQKTENQLPTGRRLVSMSIIKSAHVCHYQ